MLIRIAAAVLFASTIANAQISPDIQSVLERLDKLEAENARLREGIEQPEPVQVISLSFTYHTQER